MLASEFQPVYDNDVIEYLVLADGVTPKPNTLVNISDKYCLSLQSAFQLITFIADLKPTVVLAPPIAQAFGSPFKFNKNVPWLVFPDGTKRNAGQLAIYWGMPGVSDPVAMVRLDVGTLVEGQ